MKRVGETIFTNYTLLLQASSAQLRFSQLAIKAGLSVVDADNELKPTVTASQLRDGAATAMASGNVNSDLCKIFRRHACGIEDHYVKRNPMSATKCEDSDQNSKNVVNRPST